MADMIGGIDNQNLSRFTVFDSKAVTDSYAAFDANTTAVCFIINNKTAKELLIRRGASGDTITLDDNDTLLLYGDPANYQAKNNTDTGSVTVQLIIHQYR